MKIERNRYSDSYPPVARDGFIYIAAGIVLTLAAFIWLSKILSLLLGMAVIFIIWFFRDPRRQAPGGDDLILSPADGTVLSIAPCSGDPDIGSGNVVSIFMSVFNVHVNRCPVSGVVRTVRHISGNFLAAFKKEAPDANERNIVVFEGKKGMVKCIQIAGLIARRIVCRLKVGEEITSGQRYGMIKFGSRVDMYIPSSYELAVNPGDRVKGALTIIARLEEVEP